MPNTKYKKRLKAVRDKEHSKLKRFRIGLCIAYGFEIVLVIVILLVGAHTEHLKKNCTKSVNGVVVSVEEHKERVANLNPNHGGRYKYQTVFATTISIEKAGKFGKSEIITNDGHYKEGQELKIYYDPNDPSDYYIEDRIDINNTTQIVIIVIAVMWSVVCLLLTWITYKQYKKYKNGKFDLQ